jgi:hypothetical protein
MSKTRRLVKLAEPVFIGMGFAVDLLDLVARALGNAVKLKRSMKLENPGLGLVEPAPK